jgi:hypothetical protein
MRGKSDLYLVARDGWKVDGKKVGRKLFALELVGPLVVVAAGHQVCRGQTLQVWVDNAGSVEVYHKGYSRNCRLCTTLVKAMATVAAGIGGRRNRRDGRCSWGRPESLRYY